ncbi:MAG TPA: TetR/AcrR family transcriptional regulator [Steroidobacteraceae bacterium]|nr:TetR/AcrR family transcriptional regulator [Steroidobacteraceae bacterium]
MANSRHETAFSQEPGSRKASILDAAITVFGTYGYRKTSVDDLAEAAQISKQGLYLHFASKDDIFLAALKKYLDDGLVLVEQALSTPKLPLLDRLTAAMDMWFGRHLVTFQPAALDVIEAGDRMPSVQIEQYKAALRGKLTAALSESNEFAKVRNVCTPKEIASVLFTFGLTWKDRPLSRADFLKHVRLCIRACCQV